MQVGISSKESLTSCSQPELEDSAPLPAATSCRVQGTSPSLGAGSLKPVSHPAGRGCAFSCLPPSHQRWLSPHCLVPKPQRVLAHRPETINGLVATNMNITQVATPSLHFQGPVTNVAGPPVSARKCQRQRLRKGPTVTRKSAAAGDFQLFETCRRV